MMASEKKVAINAVGNICIYNFQWKTRKAFRLSLFVCTDVSLGNSNGNEASPTFLSSPFSHKTQLAYVTLMGVFLFGWFFALSLGYNRQTETFNEHQATSFPFYLVLMIH